MKKFLTLLLLLGTFAVFSLNPALAAEDDEAKPKKKPLPITESSPTIAVFVHLDPRGVADPNKSANVLYESVKEDLQSNHSVNIVPFDTCYKILRKYIRENQSTDTVRESDLGFMPKEKDLKALAKEANADYVVYVHSRITDTKQKMDVWWGTKRSQHTILTEIIVVDKDVTSYLVDEAVSGRASGSSEDRAFNNALERTLTKINLSKIKFEKKTTDE